MHIHSLKVINVANLAVLHWYTHNNIQESFWHVTDATTKSETLKNYG